MPKVTMSKLYQFTTIFIVILFFTGCGGSASIKKDTKKTSSTDDTRPFDSSAFAAIAVMSTDEKIEYAEKLFTSALLPETRSSSEKNTLLSNALLLCTQILVDFQQLKLVPEQTVVDISPEQSEYAQQLAGKIMGQLDIGRLSPEQKNQLQLSSAAISLTNYQIEKTLSQLNIDFDSIQNEQWSLYYQLRAMADFQLGQASKAVKELIIRHGYLLTETQKQANLNLIWNYLASIDLHELKQKNSFDPDTKDLRTISDSDDIYYGWLKLAKILRDSKDPQTMNHAINFWLQNNPSHQADRAFINRVIQIRQASILNIRHIAVLLPLQGKLAKPAKAIHDGIMASHYESPLSANLQLRFYDTSKDEYIWRTYQQAIDDGADFVIGPLAKTKVEMLSDSAAISVPTLALNSIEPVGHPEPADSPEPANSPEQANSPEPTDSHEPVGSPESNNSPNSAVKNSSAKNSAHLFQFGLSPESAARMVAKKGRQDGHYYAAVMAPDNPWGKRMKNAFSAYWQQSGGIVVDTVDYQSENHDFSDTIKSMLNIDLSESRKKAVSRTIGRQLEFTPSRRQDIDMLFMAAFPRQAKQIPLQVIYHHGETIPVYSTSHIVANYHNARQNIDMDGVHFPDMPFLLGSIENTVSQQNTYQSTLYQRLFAMGVDSYQLAPYVDYLYKNPSESFSGDTGKITIDHKGHIVRSLPWATFDKGKVKLQNSELNSDSNNSSSSNINSSNDNASLH